MSNSFQDPAYSSGTFYHSHDDENADHSFKAETFLSLFEKVEPALPFRIESYADVGCGTGRFAERVTSGLRERGQPTDRAVAFDVSPHVKELKLDGVEALAEDFLAHEEAFDLVTLIDVFEHVPSPQEFVSRVAEQALVVGFNIPLDWNALNWLRDRPRRHLSNPGHLVCLEAGGALNLLAQAGVRVIDYTYAPSFMAPSGHSSLAAKALLPLRWATWRVNPWLASVSLGGTSLSCIGLGPRGLERMPADWWQRLRD